MNTLELARAVAARIEDNDHVHGGEVRPIAQALLDLVEAVERLLPLAGRAEFVAFEGPPDSYLDASRVVAEAKDTLARIKGDGS